MAKPTASVFDHLNKEDRAKLLYEIIVAAKDDIKAQGRKFSLKALSDRIKGVGDVGNDNIVRLGYYTGKKLSEGINLHKSPSFIVGRDLFYVVNFFLHNEGNYNWPSLKALIGSKGQPIKSLLEIKPIDARKALIEAKKAIKSVDLDSINFANQLRDLANQIEPLEQQILDNDAQITIQKHTILKMSRENTKLEEENNDLKSKLAEIEKALKRLDDGIADEKDPIKKEEMRKQFHIFNKEFESLQEKA
ncbi:MAG: hypothetical protein AAFP08_01950 [Bacteroidota bacterium]